MRQLRLPKRLTPPPLLGAPLLLVSVILVVLAASSRSHGHDDAVPCTEGTTTLEINDCMANQLEAAEAKLDTAYSALLDRLIESDLGSEHNADVKHQVEEAQSAWRTFSRADCDAKYAIYASGTIRNVVFLHCMIDHTERRIRALEDYITF